MLDVLDAYAAYYARQPELTVQAPAPTKPRRTRGQTRPGTKITRLSQIEAKPLSWLWQGRIPIGALTILEGDAGIGKSSVLLDLAARVTTGRPMPGEADSAAEPAGVVLITTEDDLATTIRPRLDAAEADPDRIAHIDGTRRLKPTQVRDAIGDIRARLVVVEPLNALLNAKEQVGAEARHRLDPFVRVMQEMDASMASIRHLAKARQRSAMHQGAGGVDILALARSGLRIGPDPDDPRRMVVAPIKANLAKDVPSITYRLITAENGQPRVEWGELSALTADDLSRRTNDGPAELQRAVAFLLQVLRGGPIATTDVEEQAAARGISESTLNRARRVLVVQSRRIGQAWYMELP